MGGSESKFEDKEILSTYKQRKQFMIEAVATRNAFAAAHSAYAMSLKNTGAALSDYAHLEFSYDPSVPPPPSASSINIGPPLSASLQRAGSMSEMEPKPAIMEGEMTEEKVESPAPASIPIPAPLEKKGDGKLGRRARKPRSLMEIFADLDDHFLKAFESTREVSNMMVAIRLQFNSKGPIDHFDRVMNVITWNPSFEGTPSSGDFNAEENESHATVSEENESHATVSDEMLAWEKKLYDEVKAGEIMKYEYQTKVALLNKQKKRGSNNKLLEKLQASACQLHTRYTVDLQSVDSIVAEINHLRDQQLYPNLVGLVDGMAKMWETIRYHHEAQSTIAYGLKSVDDLQPRREISDYFYERTSQLYAVVQWWHTEFCRLTDFQKDYVKALSNWLELNLIPIESNLKEKVPSSPRVPNLPIQELLLAWNDDLDKLPDELARSAMSNFAAVMQVIMYQKEEEMKMGEKCESIRKEFNLKSRQFQDWCLKNIVNEELAPDNPLKTAKDEREAVLISLQEDEKSCLNSCKRAREKSLASFKRCLPELFRAMSEFALACSVMYSNLRSIAENP